MSFSLPRPYRRDDKGHEYNDAYDVENVQGLGYMDDVHKVKHYGKAIKGRSQDRICTKQSPTHSVSAIPPDMQYQEAEGDHSGI